MLTIVVPPPKRELVQVPVIFFGDEGVHSVLEMQQTVAGDASLSLIPRRNLPQGRIPISSFLENGLVRNKSPPVVPTLFLFDKSRIQPFWEGTAYHIRICGTIGK